MSTYRRRDRKGRYTAAFYDGSGDEWAAAETALLKARKKLYGSVSNGNARERVLVLCADILKEAGRA